MEKWEIPKRLFNKPVTMSGFKQKNHEEQVDPSDRLINDEGSISQKKTVKIISQPRKKIGIQKNTLGTSQIEGMLAENDSSAQQFNSKTPFKDSSFPKSKIQGQQVNLKTMLSSYRLGNLRRHLINKMRKNSVFRTPIIFQPFFQNVHEADLWKGIEVQRKLLNLAFVISITQTFFTCFLITLLFVFQDKFFDDSMFSLFQIFTIICQFCQIIMGFVRVKQKGSRKLTKIKEITFDYLRSRFLIDILCLLATFVCLSISNNDLNYLLVVFFFKIPECVERLVKIETKIFQSFYWQQYWGLMKILLTNFLYAHFIAILILMMSWLDNEQSWMNIKMIVDAPWYQQYAWAYYWGTTIMLTVGFGDLAAANYKEAICLVLIETVSCMALAYNINCIGNLLKQLNSKQLQKQKSLKVLKKLCDKNEINHDLDFKLTNHIKQSYNIETKFNFEEETQFIQKLPVNLKEDFLRTANYKILSNLAFIKNFTHKTIFALAEKIEMKITHPDQLLAGISDVNKIIVLKQGQIGFFPNHFNANFSKIVIDKFTVNEGGASALVSLEFLQLPMVRKYDIKSIVYSKVYFMQTQTMLTILKRKDVDKQFFQCIRDKQKTDLDEFQTMKCTYCESKHTKFRCPKLHYMPIYQQIIFKHLHLIKVTKNNRIFFLRMKQQLNSLKQYRKNKEISGSQFLFFQSAGQIDIDQDIGQPQNHYSKKNGKRFVRLSSIIKDFDLSLEKQKKTPKSKSSNELKTNMFISAAELVQKQMLDLFVEKEVQFWQVETDEVKDYKFYFSKHNPKLLENLQLKKAQFPLKSFSKVNLKMKSSGYSRKTP